MEILSRPRKTLANLPAAAPAPSAAGGGITGLNPALQQAIDSLVKNGPNLLSSLGKTGAASTGGGDSSGPGGGDKMAAGGNLGGYYSSLFGGGASGTGSGGAGSTVAGAYQ